MAARIGWLSARLMIRPALGVGSYLPSAPWRWGVVEFAARAITPAPGTVRAGIGLAHCTAQLVRAAAVLPADGTRRVVLYLHGGAFLACGAHSHGRLVSMLSNFADSPVLVPNYRKIPKHSISDAIDDCYDGYSWLRRKGYEPDQIVLAGAGVAGPSARVPTRRADDPRSHPLTAPDRAATSAKRPDNQGRLRLSKMDFGALPPEINSGGMYSRPGSPG